jgi:hypothetical protein
MTLSALHVLATRSVLVDFAWLISCAGLIASWAGVVVGLAVIMLSLPRGSRSDEHYGSWDGYIV